MDKSCDIIVLCSKPSVGGGGAEDTTQSVKRLLCKFKDPSSDPQLPRAKPGTLKGVLSSQHRGSGDRTPRAGQPAASLAEPQAQSLGKRLGAKKITWRGMSTSDCHTYM